MVQCFFSVLLGLLQVYLVSRIVNELEIRNDESRFSG